MRINFSLPKQPIFLVTTALVLLTVNPALSDDDVVWACGPDVEADLSTDGTLRVLSLNISHGRNTAINQLFVSKKNTYRNLDKVAELLKEIEPDIVAFQEADAPSRWSGKFDHVAYVAGQAGYPCFVHGRHSESWISSYGTALLSNSQPSSSTSVRFSPSWPSKQKGYASATYDWRTAQWRQPVTLTSVHFDFLRKGVRDQQVVEMADGLAQVDAPLILMGDLNSEWDEENSHVRKLAELLNLRPYKPMQEGLGSYKGPDGKRLDWILISPELEFKDYKVLPDVVADHFAVFAEITYREQQE